MRKAVRSCLEIRILEVALRLWSVQGAMGAKIRRPTRNNLPKLRSLDHIKPCSASRA
ncbi:MAG: hypothetical protein BECKG1743E_GA0114224_112133, partial [Candidatus Kentron sp. G]